VDFLYLNVADARNDSVKGAFGFRATPHFFFVSAAGAVRDSMQGVVPADSVRAAPGRLIGQGANPRPRGMPNATDAPRPEP
jgi:thioredoxin-like negative regulator of GroEL